MSLGQALFIGLLQGATELFPVSSLGHAVLLPRLLGWNVSQSDPRFVPYLVLLHLGTALALLLVFRDEWGKIALAFIRAVYRGRVGDDPNEKLALLLLIGTVPTAAVGAFFESDLRALFGSPRAAALFLTGNAAIMGAGEVLRRREEKRRRVRSSTIAREGAFERETDLGYVTSDKQRRFYPRPAVLRLG